MRTQMYLKFVDSSAQGLFWLCNKALLTTFLPGCGLVLALSTMRGWEGSLAGWTVTILPAML